MKLQGNMKINDAGHLEIAGCDTVQLLSTVHPFGLWMRIISANSAACLRRLL